MAILSALAARIEAVISGDSITARATALAETLIARGLRIVSGGTDSHVMLVDLRAKKMTGKEAERVLGEAHITCNKNGIPNDPEKPMVTSGIRLGSPAMTTRGFKEAEAIQVGNFIADVLDKIYTMDRKSTGMYISDFFEKEKYLKFEKPVRYMIEFHPIAFTQC